MNDFNIPIGLAFLAGLASFLSPCVLSLVPVYIGYLSGRAVGGESTSKNRWITFSHGLAFVLGFSLVFIFFNIIAGALGGLLFNLRAWLAKIGGVVVIIFGLHMIGVFRIPFLEYDVRVHSQTDSRWGYLSSLLMGIFFSAGWSPCVGPILGAIMTFAINGGSVIRGTMLGAVYSAGLAIPFLLAALGIGWVTTILRRYAKVMRIAEVVMGIILIVAGILLFLGSFNILASYVPFLILAFRDACRLPNESWLLACLQELFVMITVTLYTRAGCKLCEEAEADLKALQEIVPHKLAVVDIDLDSSLRDAYALEIPVVEAGPFKLKAPFTRQQLQMTLGAATDRRDQLERINDKAFQLNTSGAQKISYSDRFSYWLSKHYLALFTFFLVLYVGIPFLAPVFKRVGWSGPAEVIYKVYSPLCHQWAFRSFFLFGEQVDYPHASANVRGVLTFEQVSGITDQNDPTRIQARLFEGNPVLGYKVAFCERDVAIWGAMALFALIYAATGRRLPKLHWLIWLLAGLGPIGLDGFSQLLSQIPNTLIQSFLPYRESTPFLRTLTGFIFGFSTAWFMFPLLEETMVDTRRMLSKKFAIFKS